MLVILGRQGWSVAPQRQPWREYLFRPMARKFLLFESSNEQKFNFNSTASSFKLNKNLILQFVVKKKILIKNKNLIINSNS